MRKNLYIWLWVILFISSSCHDFFKESSQDLIKPSSVEDLRSVMYKEAYPYQFASDNYLMFLTDEIQCNGLLRNEYATQHGNATPVFTFNPMMFDGGEVFPTNDVNSWKIYYEKIKGCNVIIDYVSEVSGTEQEKNALLGQAMLLRGYYHLKLAMIYCQAYRASGVDPENALGIPLMLTMDLTDEYPERPSLKASYAQIEKDLLEAASLLKENYTPESVYRVGDIAAYVLLSRFYLFRGEAEDLDKAIQYAGKAIEEGPMLSRLSVFSGTDKSVFDSDQSTEVVWNYGTNSFKNTTYFFTSAYSETVPWSISTELLNQYGSNDLRRSVYFVRTFGSGEYGGKIGRNSSYGGDHGIRMAEAYLNRAEALARRFMAKGDGNDRVQALHDLNTLRETRYVDGTYVEEEIADAQDLLDFCLQERRLELCIEEGFRWFDIKRLGLSVTHKYIDSEGVEQEYVLESNSLLYALPISYDAIERNYKLKQNPR